MRLDKQNTKLDILTLICQNVYVRVEDILLNFRLEKSNVYKKLNWLEKNEYIVKTQKINKRSSGVQ